MNDENRFTHSIYHLTFIIYHRRPTIPEPLRGSQDNHRHRELPH